jgi:hypothetical protein
MPSTVSKIRYSPTEQSVLAILPDDGTKLTSDQIMDSHYGRRKPLNARKIIIGVMRSLIIKSNRNKETFRICKSARKGPHPMKFWMERR